jgi:hypothetical protein
MASSWDDNVVALPLPTSRNGPPTELLEMLRSAVHALDELDDGFERIKPSLHWSLARWSAASIPFRMRLVSAERQLEGLRQIDPANWPDIRWAIDLSSARVGLEQQLQAVVNLLDMLLHCDMSPGERAWLIQRFNTSGKGFSEALRRLRKVIVTRHPEVCRPP